jgi:hypothetical protein
MGIRTQLTDITNLLEKFEIPGDSWFVDGTNGDDDYSGTDWEHAFATIQAAIDAASAHDTIFVKAKTMAAGATDPVNYAETLTIAAAKSSLKIIGVSNGRTQGGLPQIKKGSGSTALLTVRAPGCLIANLCFNGGSSTGGGILLDDDGSTKSAFGTTIENCYFKNCAGSSATNAATGGAIQWSANGGAWQTRIKGCRFYKNVGDIVVIGTGTIPQDVIIEDCVFSGPAANVDCNLFLAGGGDGINGVIIRNCVFGQLPALGGTNDRYIIATGCVGMLVDCVFGCQTNTTGGTKKTFQANGTAAKIPTTMHIARCYGQSITASESGEITIAS